MVLRAKETQATLSVFKMLRRLDLVDKEKDYKRFYLYLKWIHQYAEKYKNK